MKDPYHVMKIVANLMTLDELEVSKTRRYFTASSVTKKIKLFT